MKQYHYICFIIIGLLLSTSCVDDVVFDRPGEKPIVVNCVLKYPAREQVVSVVYASAAGSNSPGIPIKDAAVSIQDLSDPSHLKSVFEYHEDIGYSAALRIIPEHHYRLEIKIKDKEIIYSETTVPAIKTITVKDDEVSPVFSDFTPLKAYTYDIKELFGQPFWIYAMNYEESSNDWQIAKQIVATYKGIRQFVDGFVDVFSVTDDYIIYSGYQTEPHYLYKNYLRFTGDTDNSWPFSNIIFVDGSLIEPYYTLEEKEVEITPVKEYPPYGLGSVVLIIPSTEYDIFLKELFVFKEKKEDMEDLTLLYEMNNLYSNINGAKGVFGAQVIYYLPWHRPNYSF